MTDKKLNEASSTDNFESFPAGQINMSKWISGAVDLVMANFAEFLLLSFIYVVLLIVASTTFIAALILGGPLTAGFFYIIFQRMRGKPINIGDLAKGFNFFIAAMMADILITVFVSVGFFFLIIPGIVISAFYLFAFPLIIEKNMDFWQAMETSRKLVTKNIFEFSAFTLLLYIFLFSGVLLLVVGFFVALPIVFAAIAFAYKEMIGLEEPATENIK